MTDNAFQFQMRECLECYFRFPVTDPIRSGESCPQCHAATQLAALFPATHKPVIGNESTGPEVELLLDNLRSVYNVGSVLRTADGADITHVYACGTTPPPTHPKIAKTALGAETTVSHTTHYNGLQTAAALLQQGYQLWALESTPTSESLFSITTVQVNAPIVLVIGNEVAGVDPAILNLCHKTIHIPMHGLKESLNVAVACGIAIFHLRFGTILR